MMEELEEPPEKIIDDDGNVDSAMKNLIVRGRRLVIESRMVAYRDAVVDPNASMSQVKQLRIYGMAVEELLILIEPLLRSEQIPSANEYYNNAHLGNVVITPPDTDGYEFSLVSYSNRDEAEVKRKLGLPRGAELPEPIVEPFNGLRSVIEHDLILKHTWEVCIDDSGPPPQHEYCYPQAAVPVPVRIYTNAVRAAGQFLQNAGIGVETDTAGSEMIREFDMSGDEPNSEYSVGTYTSDPDL